MSLTISFYHICKNHNSLTSTILNKNQWLMLELQNIGKQTMFHHLATIVSLWTSLLTGPSVLSVSWFLETPTKQTPCCGNAFCKDCIIRKLHKKPCPTCKTEDFLTYPDKELERELYSSQVCCSFKPRGCDWRDELKQLDQHLNSNSSQDNLLAGCPSCKSAATTANTSYIECIYEYTETRCVSRDPLPVLPVRNTSLTMRTSRLPTCPSVNQWSVPTSVGW